jgi:hypothetical protein
MAINNKTLYYHFVGKIVSGALKNTLTADTLYDLALEKMDEETIPHYLSHAIKRLVNTTWIVPTDEIRRSRRDPKTYHKVYQVNHTKRQFILDWQPSPYCGGDR